MVISRKRLYLLIVIVLLGLCGLYQTTWLFSRVTNGEIAGFGHGTGGRGYRSVQNTTINYIVAGQTYTESYLRNGTSDTATTMGIRYLIFSPSISRENTWIGNWGGPMLFFIITFLITTIVFLQDSVIPFSTRFQIDRKYPFVKMLNYQEPIT